ncbi:MAG TPA: FkbM family methyltransferase [Bacillota bacterium]|nr:FkbM family methyltransferase [Bacillota bacterium]
MDEKKTTWTTESLEKEMSYDASPTDKAVSMPTSIIVEPTPVKVVPQPLYRRVLRLAKRIILFPPRYLWAALKLPISVRETRKKINQMDALLRDMNTRQMQEIDRQEAMRQKVDVIISRADYLVAKTNDMDKILSTHDSITNDLASIQEQMALLQEQSNAYGTDLLHRFDAQDLQMAKNLGLTCGKIDAHGTQIYEHILRNQNDWKTAITGSNGAICIQYNHYFILGIPSGEWRFAMYLSRGNYFEYGSEMFFRSLLKEGMKVLDIGANVGVYTLHALSLGCEVYSFEPTPETFTILSTNLDANGYEFSKKKHLYNIAVSDHEGTVEFAKVKDISGHNSIYAENEADERIIVPCDSIDHVLADVPEVDVIKIDVEGAEPLVLKGLRSLISRSKKIGIIVEYTPGNLNRAGTNEDDYFAMIASYGLSLSMIEEDGTVHPVTREEIKNVDSVNLFLSKGE